MQFSILFTVSISHSYYTQGCEDFSFTLPADSAQLLKNGKLIAKVLDGKLYVLFAVDETGEALVSLEGKTLRIGLQLLNPYFNNFTKLDFDFHSSRLLYRNVTASGALDPAQEIALVGQVFSHSLKIKARPVTVRLKNTNGQILQTDIITAANDRSTVSYDLTGQAAGLYSVEESDSSNTKTLNYYSDLELQQQGIFGVIEIEIASSFYSTPPEFVIPFLAKQETLKYYLVANNYSESDFNQLSILDKGEVGRSQISFLPKVLPTDFTDDDISPTLLGNGDAQIALFKSQQAVRRQEKARKNIQLQKQNNGGVDELIKHLPQPGADKANSDLIVQLTKPKP
jgi:hypothetical protein